MKLLAVACMVFVCLMTGLNPAWGQTAQQRRIGSLNLGDLERLDITSRQWQQIVFAINKTVTGKEFDELVTQLPAAARELNSTLRRFQRLLATRQPEIGSLLQNLQAISENLRQITEIARKYPSGVLLGDPPKERDQP